MPVRLSELNTRTLRSESLPSACRTVHGPDRPYALFLPPARRQRGCNRPAHRAGYR